MADATEFEIYQTSAGYVAVTNEVRRMIVAALAKRERELPELVKITGKAKPTLSNLHMKELLAQGIIGERPHPTDARRKIYHLAAQRIGSSNVPIDQLRGAVKQYVSRAPLAHSLPPAEVLAVLLHGSGEEALHRQGRALGKATATVVPAENDRELLTAVATYWEREGFARTGTIDLDRLRLEVELEARHAADADAVARAAAVLAGFVEGVAEARPGAPRRTASAEIVRGLRVRITLRPTG